MHTGHTIGIARIPIYGMLCKEEAKTVIHR